MPRCQVTRDKQVKIGAQGTTGGWRLDLLQERNGHFNGREVCPTVLSSQGIGGRSLRLNSHPGYALQIRTSAEDLAGLAPGAIEQHERRYSVRQPRALMQALKERWITVGGKHMRHKPLISQERHEGCGGSGTVPRKETRVWDGRAY